MRRSALDGGVGLPRAAHIEDALPLLDVESGRVTNAKPERASHGDGDIRLRNQCEGFDRRVVDLSGRVRLLDRRRDRVYPADVPDISIRFARLALQHMDGRRGGGQDHAGREGEYPCAHALQ